MALFSAPDWDTENVGDDLCKEMFQDEKRKKKLKTKKIEGGGKIKKLEKKFSKKLKNAIEKQIDNGETVAKIPDKIKKEKTTKEKSKTEQTTKTNLSKKQKPKIKKLAKLNGLKHSMTIQKNNISNSTQNLIEKPRKSKQKIEENPKKDHKKMLEELEAKITNKKHTSKTPKKKQMEIEETTKKPKPVLTLRQKMMEKLKAARFRFLNEQIYTTTSKEAEKIFKTDPEAFSAYHNGYRQQVKRWPVNPLDVVIKKLKKLPKTHVIADFGCGEAKLAKSLGHKVHSFDLVAIDDTVIACDMAHVPLADDSVDVAVFCLSLMGTNLNEYLLEANRTLKIGGTLKIAEVESRFENVEEFIEGVQKIGFKKTWMDLSHNLFYFIDFKKESTVKNKKKTNSVNLLPCLYKKR